MTIPAKDAVVWVNFDTREVMVWAREGFRRN